MTSKAGCLWWAYAVLLDRVVPYRWPSSCGFKGKSQPCKWNSTFWSRFQHRAMKHKMTLEHKLVSIRPSNSHWSRLLRSMHTVIFIEHGLLKWQIQEAPKHTHWPPFSFMVFGWVQQLTVSLKCHLNYNSVIHNLYLTETLQVRLNYFSESQLSL